MENKIKKRSINSLIYLLLAAMLVGVIGVSVYTVDSRRKPTNPDTSVQDSTKAPDSTNVGKDSTSSTDDKTPSDTSAKQNGTDTAPKDTAASATEDEVPASINVRYFVPPAIGAVSKDFEIDVPVYSTTMNDYRAHSGVDIASELGGEVVSASSGIVCRVWNDPMMGRSVTIDHGEGIYTTYKNLMPDLASGIEVGAGVTMGQTIGAVGESALIEIAEEPHLHFEMKVDGEYVDPLEYIKFDNVADSEYES